MVVAWLIAVRRLAARRRLIPARGGSAPYAAPYRAWDGLWRLIEHRAPRSPVPSPSRRPPYRSGSSRAGPAGAYRRFRMRSGAWRPHPESPGAIRRAAVAATRCGAAQALIAAPGSLPLPFPRRARGGRRDDPRRRAPCLATRGWSSRYWSTLGWPARGAGRAASIPYEAAARAPGCHRVDGNREDHAAASAVGRVHGRRAAPVRRRCRAAAAARGARLQGRRVVKEGRGPHQAGAAGRGRTVDRDLARRGRRCRCGRCLPTGW